MGLLDKLKPTPRWKHADPAVRLEAVRELDDPIELAILAETDTDARVRRAAIPRTVDPAVLAEVRRRVMSEVVDRRPSLLYAWRWKYALAAAAVAVLAVGAGVSVRRPVEVPPVEVATVRRPARVPARQAEEPAPRKVVRQAGKPALQLPARKAEEPAPRTEAEPLLVKLVTDDPEVVVYWLVDRTGD